MFPSINMQIGVQDSNDNAQRLESNRLMDNTDSVLGDQIVVTDNDVFFGRGGKKNQHPGNKKLRHMAFKYSSFYQAALKKEKPLIALLLVYLVKSTKPSGRFLKQGEKGQWEVASEEEAREKAGQCIRDTFATVSKLGEKAKVPRGTTSEELLNEIELEEAKSFVRASMAVLRGQATGMDGEMSETKPRATSAPDFPAPNMKRPRSVPNSNSETEQQHYFKRPSQYASLSQLDNTTFGTHSYIHNTFSALLPHQLPLGDARHERMAKVELPSSNYSLGNNVWGPYPGKVELPSNNYSLGNDVWGPYPGNEPSDDEYACVQQAIQRAEQLKGDDSAFQRLIDRTLKEK